MRARLAVLWRTWALLALLVVMAPLAAMAQTDLPPVEGLAKIILDAVMGGKWALLASAAVTLLVTLASTYGGGFIPFLTTGPGRAILSLLLGVAGGAMTALLAGADSFPAVLKGIEVGVVASGGWSLFKAIVLEWLWPILKAKLFPPPPVAPVA